MPVLSSNYEPSNLLLKNAHLSTIAPALLRRVEEVSFQRETIDTPDGDFLDLDWWRPAREGEAGPKSASLVIVLHGLEGSADRPYVKGMCRFFAERGWDALGLNQRTCGGRMNRLLRAYHMGSTDDLGTAIHHAIDMGYEEIGLVGFSMGGNHVLKYLGEKRSNVPVQITAGVAFSVPCHIESANKEIDQWHNRLYLNRFLKGLNEKMRHKARQFPDKVDISTPLPKSFAEFDDRYTGPIHGFSGAIDYWTKCSSRQFIPTIERPALLVNADDDTFLSEACYPYEEAREMDHFFLEIPHYGGHVGFGRGRDYWSERRAFEFITQMGGSRNDE